LSTFSNSDGFRVLGASSSDDTGISVAVVDLNNDGYGDVVLGAPYADPLSRNSAGIANVIYGKANGFVDVDLSILTSVAGYKILGENSGDYLARTIAFGDVNGDGRKELMLAGDFFTTSQAKGFVSVLSPEVDFVESTNSAIDQGATNPVLPNVASIDLSTVPLTKGYKIVDAENSSYFGVGAASGDINGDGYDDIVASAPQADPLGRTDAGVVYVTFGKAANQSNIDLSSANDGFKITGAYDSNFIGRFRYNPIGNFAKSSIAVGDINGDGYEEIIIGAPDAKPYYDPINANNGRNAAGMVYVLYGKANGFADIDLQNLSASDGFKILGAYQSNGSTYFYGDRLGSSVAVGDVNGDGFGDIVIGAITADPLYDPITHATTRNSAGVVFVIYGKVNAFSDIDLASMATNQGAKILASDVSGEAGYSLDIGNVNGDNYADIVIAAPEAAPLGRFEAGAVYVVYGKASFTDTDLKYLDSATGLIIMGEKAGDKCGVSVAVGDINNDGYGDIVIGAPIADAMGRSNAGVGYVILYNQGLQQVDLLNLSSYVGFKIQGASSSDDTGMSVAVVDINNDGYSDVVVGAPYSDPLSRSSAGIANVVYGKANGFADVDLSIFTSGAGFKILGAERYDNLGRTIVFGDVNGDGNQDLIFGGGSSSAGFVYAVTPIVDFIQPVVTTTTASSNPTTVSASTAASGGGDSTTALVGSNTMNLGGSTTVLGSVATTSAEPNVQTTTTELLVASSAASRVEPWVLQFFTHTIASTVETLKHGVEFTNDCLVQWAEMPELVEMQ
jgi:hypothetical protein